MKKVTTFLILQFIFVSFVFCGCSRNTILNDTENLTYYYSKENYTSLIDLIQKYNISCSDESYKIEIVEFKTESEMNIKMSTEIMSGEGPDIFSLSQKLPFEKLASNNIIADINEIINSYGYDIGLSSCNRTIMNVGVIDGKRYFVPLFYSPDVFITTEKTLKKYKLSSSDFSYKALSDNLINSGAKYSLLGSTDYNLNLFYSFLGQYIDYNDGNTEFNTDEFSENLDYIYNLINNDYTNENTYYFLYENINNGSSVLYKEFSSFDMMARTYAFLNYFGGTPTIINNYNKEKNTISASVDLGLAINNNCKSKDKLLAFIKYCLSDSIQISFGSELSMLPVNNNAFGHCAGATDKPIDFDENGSVDDNEKALSKNAHNDFLNDYNHIINNISECNLYSFYNLSETYFNSSVIGDVVNKYLKGDISKEKFIRQLTAATEIYLTE